MGNLPISSKIALLDRGFALIDKYISSILSFWNMKKSITKNFRNNWGKKAKKKERKHGKIFGKFTTIFLLDFFTIFSEIFWKPFFKMSFKLYFQKIASCSQFFIIFLSSARSKWGEGRRIFYWASFLALYFTCV